MLTTGIANFAKRIGLKLDGEVAYGVYQGYVMALTEDPKNVLAVFTTQFLDEESQRKLIETSNKQKVSQYYVKRVERRDTTIRVTFKKYPDVTQKMEAFFGWFVPLLDELGAVKGDLCVQCGKPVQEKHPWLLVEGDTAYHMHEECTQKVERKAKNILVKYYMNEEGTVLRGAIGAALGALLSIIPWVIASNYGFAPVMGMLTTWMAGWGFSIARGRADMSKVWTMLAASCVGVVLACLACDGYGIYTMIKAGQLAGATYWQIPKLLVMLMGDGEYLISLLKNILFGEAMALLALVPTYRGMRQTMAKLDVKTRRLN